MAYAKPRTTACSWPGCTRTARFEVFNDHNAPCGLYCAKHSKLKVKELKEKETPAGVAVNDGPGALLTIGDLTHEGDSPGGPWTRIPITGATKRYLTRKVTP